MVKDIAPGFLDRAAIYAGHQKRLAIARDIGEAAALIEKFDSAMERGEEVDSRAYCMALEHLQKLLRRGWNASWL